MEERPESLPYRAKDGIYTTYLPPPSARASGFAYFVDKAIAWSDANVGPSGGFSILDTFMADFLGRSQIDDMLRRSSSHSPVRLLLADPYSAFADARASAINDGTAEDRSRSGLIIILGALENYKGRDARGLDSMPFPQLLGRMNEIISSDDVPLQVRYYGVVPSGPMLFLNDILIAGHYCVDLSSMRLPWVMIVDDPTKEGDRFDFYKIEFDNIWNNYSFVAPGLAGRQAKATMQPATPSAAHEYFLSYTRSDVDSADHIEVLLRRKERRIVRDEVYLQIGGSFEEVLPELIESSGTFVALFSSSYLESDFCMGEFNRALEQLRIKREFRLAVLLLEDSVELRRRIPMRAQVLLTAPAHSRDERRQTINDLTSQEHA